MRKLHNLVKRNGPGAASGTSESTPENLGPVAPLFPIGIKVLHDCQQAAVVDICFVHGLTGDRERTWSGLSEPWPKALLPLKLDNARILTYGYDAYVVARKGEAGQNRLIDHATNLIPDLAAHRAEEGASRPIIFVAHSLGGLVCKEALLLARNSPEHCLREVFTSTKGIIFMGTPHKGSCMAQWAKIPASVIALVKSTNISLLDVLQMNSQYLDAIQVKFLTMVRELREGGRQFEVTCFFEELPLPGFGLVVAKDSAVIEGYNSLSIHADHRNMVRFLSDEDSGFKRLLGELIRWRDQIVPPIAAQEPQLPGYHKECLKSLAFPQLQDRAHDIDDPTEGTCKWLRKHETYQSWMSSHGSLLWIKGKPGSGKSTLLNHALQNHLTALKGSEHDLTISFFFHDRGDELQKTPLGFFRALIHQAASKVPAAFLGLFEEFKQKKEEMGDWKWHEKELQRFLESALPGILAARRVWLFVDALDECGEDNAVMLFGWLQKLIAIVPSTSMPLYICVTCRHYPILGPASKLEICTEENNMPDIAAYVQAQFHDYQDIVGSPIPNLITKRSSGIFLWARFVIDTVLKLKRREEGVEKMVKEIDSTPRQLDELYRKAAQEMSYDPDCLKFIQLICFATRPLSPEELVCAMAIELNGPARPLLKRESFPQDGDQFVRRVQALSCGLAEVTSTHESFMADCGVTYESEDSDAKISLSPKKRRVSSSRRVSRRVVQFIHQSVKDFFISKGLKDLDDSPTPGDALLLAHSRIFKICIRYIGAEEICTSTGFDDWYHRNSRYRKSLARTLDHKYPLLKYAATSWEAHLKESDTETHQIDHLEVLHWPSNQFVDLLTKISETFTRQAWPRGTTLMHILSMHNLTGLLRAIFTRTRPGQPIPYIDSRDGFGRTPLSYAAGNGSENVTKLLLETGQVKADSGTSGVLRGRSPLSYAARNGQYGTVQLILESGQVEADPEDAEGFFGPLSLAILNGHFDVVQLLLRTGQVNVNSRGEENCTPLSLAVKSGRSDLVQLLLDTGLVEVHSKDKFGCTPQSYAASLGHGDTVRLLLELGKIDADSKDGYGRTLLSLAAKNGHLDVVRLLLETGQVNVNSKDEDGRTPLSYAVEHRHMDVVKLLFNTGLVEVDLTDGALRYNTQWQMERR